MAEYAKYRTPDGEILETGPGMVEALRKWYFTQEDYVRYSDRGWEPVDIMGEKYGAMTALRAVDPKRFREKYEEMLEYLVYADSDDWICDMAGFEPVTEGPRGGLRNAKPRTDGSKGSASRNRKAPAKKTSKPKASTARAPSRSAPRRY